MSSYVIAPDGTAIICKVCGSISHNADDVTYHYCGRCHRFHDDVKSISFWTIYDHPRDYPDSYVLRKSLMVFVNGQPPAEFQDRTCRVSDSVTELRAFIPSTAVNLGRETADDAVILEVWIT